MINKLTQIYTIDQGNSHPHIGFFEGQLLKDVVPLSKLNDPLKGHIVYSSVGDKKIIESLFPKAIELKDYWQNNLFFNMPIHYDEGLGEDRLYQAAYLFFKNSKPTKVLIDAGTFITVDLIDSNGLQGGFILPGVQILLKSYHQGNRLPNLEKINIQQLSTIPRSTNQAIVSGLYQIIFGPIENFLHKYTPQEIYLTGGDGDFIRSHLFSLGHHCNTDPHLIHKSLFYLAKKHLTMN